MIKKKQPIISSDMSEIRMESSIIAEIPRESDLNSFNFTPDNMLLLPLEEDVVFPGLPHPVRILNDNDLKIVEKAYEEKACVFGCTLKENAEASSRLKDYHSVGMICRVAKIVKMPDVEPVAFLLPGLRATLKKFVSKKHPLMVSVIPLPPVAPTADPHMASCVYE